jgi:diacylglycerol O-acyltransferase / wax synthase
VSRAERAATRHRGGAADSGEEAAVFRQRLTALDASFLEVESPSAHMHVGWAALFAPPVDEPAPSFEQLRDHVAARLGRAPRYRQKLGEVPLGVSDPVWIDDSDFDIARHVRRARGGDFQQVVDEVLTVPLGRDRPLWELWIADDLDDGRIGTVGKVHHCMVDGMAAVELGLVMLDPVVDPATEAEEGWQPDREPDALELLAAGVLARVGKLARLSRLPLQAVRAPGQALGATTRALRAAGSSLTPAEPAPLNEPISAVRHLARARRPLDDLREVKRARGGTVNDVVLAAAAGGLRRFMLARGRPATALKAMVPVSVRDPGAEGELGNRISFVFVELPCDEPDAQRRLQRVRAAMTERKSGGEPEGAEALLDAAEYAPRTLQRALAHVVASPRTFNVVVSNIPGPAAPLYMRGCRLEEAYPVVPLAERHGVSIGMTSVAGQACFGVYADAGSVPDGDLLAEAVAESLDELHGAPAARVEVNA